MNLNRINTVIDKEWTQAFATLSSRIKLAITPIFAGSALLIALMMLNAPLLVKMGFLDAETAAKMADNPDFKAAMAGHVKFMMDFLLAFFMTLPAVSASQVAATGLTEDKKARSLEPLLATPLTTMELLAGKILAAILPATMVGWFSYLVFASLATYRGIGASLTFGSLFGMSWMAAMLVIAPLLAILVTVIAFFYSSRIPDTHRAEMACQQAVGIIMVLPIIGISAIAIYAQAHEFAVMPALMKFTLALLLINGFLIFLSVRLFQRENILFKWK
ncbi:MAG: hypothetical protein WCS94_18565 [Verrucomicrobiota bacterium]